MKVIATEMGFFGKLREPGEEFDVPDDIAEASWFIPSVDAAKPVKPAKPAKPVDSV